MTTRSLCIVIIVAMPGLREMLARKRETLCNGDPRGGASVSPHAAAIVTFLARASSATGAFNLSSPFLNSALTFSGSIFFGR